MVYRSPYPDAWIPETCLAEFVFADAAGGLDKPALIDGPTGRVVTYGGLLRDIRRAGIGLSGMGVRPGDVVALYSPASPDTVALFHAVTTLGATVTMLNPLHTLAEMSHQLNDSGARLAITTPQGLDTVRRLTGDRPFTVLTIDAILPGDTADTVPEWPLRGDFDPRRQVAALTYSTGMTDVPMGVMLTHHSLVANIVQTTILDPFDGDEVVTSLTPFCQMYGMLLTNLALRAGATVVILPRFSMAALLHAIQQHRITTAFLVPAIIRTLAKHALVNEFDLGSLRQVISMTAPLPDSVARACSDRIGCTIRQAYGMTEAFAFTHMTPRNRARAGSVGIVLPNTEFRIVDVASYEDMAPGRLGEVWIRGPQVMTGYLNYPEVTADVLDSDGWLHTCDIGFVDEDGHLCLVDRSKKLVKLRGIHRQDDDMLRAAVEDIVARREASDRLRYQAVLLNSVRESIVVTDLRNHVTFWNKGAETLFGFSATEALGKPVDTLIMPPGQRLVRPDKTEALRTRGTWNAQVPRRRKDGSEIWTDLVVSIVRTADGERAGFVGMHRDITEQKHVERHLRFQAQLLDSVRESVVACDLDGCVVYWGKGAETLFGYDGTAMMGQHIGRLALPATDNPVAQFVRIREDVLRTGVWDARAVVCPRSGGDFWADIVVAPVRNDDGDPVGLIAIHNDVTELHENEELLKDSHERLRNLASRLMVIREQERSSIARELHDELGQALTRMSIDISWLTQQVPKRLQTTRVQSMAPLVGRMLKTVQDISSELRPPVLDDLGLEAAIEWHAKEYAEWSGCRCELDLQLGMLPRNQDRDIAVFRIVQEALTNVARHSRARVVKVRAWTSVRELHLEIEDDGIGIRDDQLKSSRSLGIIGMRERAEGLGGHIIIVAGERGGTRIAFRLRIVELSVSDVAS